MSARTNTKRKSVPSGLERVLSDPRTTDTLLLNRGYGFHPLNHPSKTFTLNAIEIHNAIVAEKRDMDRLYAEWILDLPFLKERYGHGTMENCIMSDKTIQKFKIWFPGVPSISSEIDKMCACNLFVLTTEDMTSDMIRKDPSILRKPKRWIYSYLTDKKDLIEFPEKLLDLFINKYKEDIGGRFENKIQVKEILLPYFPPQKYNNIRNKTNQATTPSLQSKSFIDTKTDSTQPRSTLPINNMSQPALTTSTQEKEEPEILGLDDEIPPSGTVRKDAEQSKPIEDDQKKVEASPKKKEDTDKGQKKKDESDEETRKSDSDDGKKKDSKGKKSKRSGDDKKGRSRSRSRSRSFSVEKDRSRSRSQSSDEEKDKKKGRSKSRNSDDEKDKKKNKSKSRGSDDEKDKKKNKSKSRDSDDERGRSKEKAIDLASRRKKESSKDSGDDRKSSKKKESRKKRDSSSEASDQEDKKKRSEKDKKREASPKKSSKKKEASDDEGKEASDDEGKGKKRKSSKKESDSDDDKKSKSTPQRKTIVQVYKAAPKASPSKTKKETKSPAKPSTKWTAVERIAWINREANSTWSDKAKDPEVETGKTDTNLFNGKTTDEINTMLKCFMGIALHYNDYQDLLKKFPDPLEDLSGPVDVYDDSFMHYLRIVYRYLHREFDAEHHSTINKKQKKDKK